MKKLDKLILTAFIGPFLLTLLVIIFILLSRQMLYYFDDIIGKDLGGVVLTRFIFYFILLTIPVALPLAVLLSSLITFGNLAEHFELTAIKSTGISLLRVILPIFFFTIFLTAIAYWSNNYLAPRAALEAYTLLYDIRQKKPTLDIREGTFYNGLPDISIKVNRKFTEDPAALKDIILYDHRNKEAEDLFVADSGRMYTIMNDRYMKFELYQGYNYRENAFDEHKKLIASTTAREALSKSEFNKLEIVFDLASFELSKTSKELFEGNKLMRNLRQLDSDIDLLTKKMARLTPVTAPSSQSFYPPSVSVRTEKENDSLKIPAWLNSIFNQNPTRDMLQAATDRARVAKINIENDIFSRSELTTSLVAFRLQWHKILANSLACIAMFLVGAPLGAIIKRGGLGVPFLISIAFFIIYTLLGMQGEKLAARHILDVRVAAWGANAILLCIGIAFLRIAQRDGRLFEAGIYPRLISPLKKLNTRQTKIA